MTLARMLVCLALADANVGQQDSAAAHQAAVAKSQQAHAKLRTLQRQLSSVESTMHSDMDSFLALSDRLDEKDAREGPGLPDVLADGSAAPSSFIQTGGKPALVQTKQEAAADKAKSQAAHAKLAVIQKQLASVNAKMQTDMQKVMAISRQQDEEDMQDEMHENAAQPSSFVETGRKKHIFTHEDQGLEVAEDKVHKAEEQLRRMKQEFDQGPDLHFHQLTTESSFAQTKQQRLMHERTPEGINFDKDPDAVDDGSMKKEHEEAKEFVSHWKHIMQHAHNEKEEYNQRREEDGSDPSSLIQSKDKKAEAKAMHRSIMNTAKSLDDIKKLLDAAVETHLAPEDVAVKMRKNEAKEKEWAKELEEKIAARRSKFNDKINHNLGVDTNSD